jgi:hypothetical protein
MTTQEIKDFVAKNIQYKDWKFVVNDKNGVVYVQIQFEAPDNFNGGVEAQHCRKWQLSEWMTPTEIVQTCWAAVQRAEMHEAAEAFKYRGRDIFNTHINVEALAQVCADRRYEHRGEPKKNQVTLEQIDKNAELIGGDIFQLQIKAKVVDHARDGGTKVCLGEDGKTYFIDRRIFTKTKGKVYDKYPSEEGAQMLNIALILEQE